MNKINKTMDLWIWPMTAVLIFLALQFISQFIVNTVDFFSADQRTNEFYFTTKVAPWAMLISSVFTIVILCFVKPFKLFKEFRIWVCDNWNALFAFIIFFITLVTTNILNEFVDAEFKDVAAEELFLSVLQNPVGVIAVVFVGPICEEVVFRAGIMKPMLDRKINPWIPIAVSSVIFGLVHMNIPQMVNAVCLGFVFAVIYYRTRSLIISTVAHIINNGATVYIMLNVANPDDYKLEQMIGKGPMIASFVLMLILLVVAIKYFWKSTEQYQDNTQKQI